jgi:Short C-terminal domain
MNPIAKMIKRYIKMPIPPSHCTQCGKELRRENMKADTKTCYSCYTQQAAIQTQQTAIQPIEFVAVTPKPAPQPAHKENPMEQLNKLKKMVEAGLIAEEEFNAKKAEILAKM